jgi:hypothetical protein
MYRETKCVKNKKNSKRAYLTRLVPGGRNVIKAKFNLETEKDFLATKMLDSQKYFFPGKCIFFFTKTFFVFHSE